MGDRAYYPCRGRSVYTYTSSSECRTNGPRRSVVYGPSPYSPEYYAGDCRDNEQKFFGGFPSVTPTNYRYPPYCDDRYPSYCDDRYRRPSNPCDDVDQLAREIGQLFSSVQTQPSRPVCQYTTSTPSNSILVSMLRPRPATHSVSAAPAPGEGGKDDDEDPNNSEYSSTDEDDDDGDEKDQVSSKPDPKKVGVNGGANRLSSDRSNGMMAPLRNQKSTANLSLDNMKTGPATARGKSRPVLSNRRVPPKTTTR